jgi:6-pyruvoyl-tetrahydropterin synthase
LNDDSAFEDRVPTAENIARVIYDVLQPVVARRTTARLVRIGVRETGKNSFAYGDME